MNHRDLLHRLAGVAFMAGAGASTCVHRAVWQAHASGPATALEGGLGMLTFFLGSLGLLLLIGGSSLRDGWKRDCEQAARRREGRGAKPAEPLDPETEHRRTMADAVHAMAFAGPRAALATCLVMQARQAALRPRTSGKAERGSIADRI
ncbi:hypothetical protein [Novosphingobium rosa]|uniref:hypothetical protein n=1 Tax=Novosphingobium rosa TaxID=76978 RepID=UPI000829650D|nr:hypothetical protein [Novosphingobium rosa]